MREDEISDIAWWRAHWVNRIFGSWAAFEAAKPARLWLRGGAGWYSTER